MDTIDIVVGIILLSQAVTGVLGNSFLLCNYLLLYFTKYTLRCTDLFLKHLTMANFLTLLCRGVPQTMAAFGLQDFFGDLGCKLLFYLHRVGRGVSIWSACLLSIFQAMTISPGNSIWADLKAKIQRYIDFFIYLIWILYLLGNIDILKNMTRSRANNNMTYFKKYGYCASILLDKNVEILIAVFLAFPDVVCMGLMLWAGSSIVLLLHRHKQRMQHLLCPRSSPEIRATKAVLLLVSTFVSFYTLSCVFQVYVSLANSPSLLLQNMAGAVAASFPTVSPFLLLSHDSRYYRLCSMWRKNRKPHHSSEKLDSLWCYKCSL